MHIGIACARVPSSSANRSINIRKIQNKFAFKHRDWHKIHTGTTFNVQYNISNYRNGGGTETETDTENRSNNRRRNRRKMQYYIQLFVILVCYISIGNARKYKVYTKWMKMCRTSSPVWSECREQEIEIGIESETKIESKTARERDRRQKTEKKWLFKMAWRYHLNTVNKLKTIQTH